MKLGPGEDEEHVILHCPMCQEIRQTLFDKILTIYRDFMQTSNIEMLCFILGNPDDYIVRQSAKFCAEVLRIRRNCLYGKINNVELKPHSQPVIYRKLFNAKTGYQYLNMYISRHVHILNKKRNLTHTLFRNISKNT